MFYRSTAVFCKLRMQAEKYRPEAVGHKAEGGWLVVSFLKMPLLGKHCPK